MRNKILISIVFLLSTTLSISQKDTEMIEKNYFIPIDSYYIMKLGENHISPDDLSESDFLSKSYYGPKTFFSTKSKTEIEFEIFSSFGDHKVIRNTLIYNNVDTIQEYFLKKYKVCFFDMKNCQSDEWRLYKKDGLNFEDFEQIIKPNLKLQLLSILPEDSIRSNGKYQVIFNWDFFLDINSYDRSNPIYKDDYLNDKYWNYELDSIEKVICFTLDYLFDYPFYRPDAILAGTSFKVKPETNLIIDKYFAFEDFTKTLTPIKRGHMCSTENSVSFDDFQAILSFFEKAGKPICEIVENGS